MTRLIQIAILGFIMSFFACQENESLEVEAYIDEGLVPIFNLFEEEARIRGVMVDLEGSGISGYFDSLADDIVGQCVSSDTRSNEVRIDNGFWSRASDMEKEFVVFHELGHCFLNRSHLDESDESGICTSMMNSGLGNCRSEYNSRTRSDYLDELFSQ